MYQVINSNYFRELVCIYFPNPSEFSYVFVFQGSHNKVPKTGWLKTTEICLLLLEVRSLRSSCLQSRMLSEASRGESFLPLLVQAFVAILEVPQLVDASLQACGHPLLCLHIIFPLCMTDSVPKCLLFISRGGFGPTLMTSL